MSLEIATLICVYGGDSAEAFEAAVASIATQRLPEGVSSNIYLGVDGDVPASTLAAIERCEGLMRVISRSPVRVGLAKQLNSLLAQLGDERFVFRMDADDIALPNRYAAQLQYMEGNPGIGILGTSILEFDDSIGTERIVSFCTGPKDAVSRIHRRTPVAHPTVCIRREVFESLGGYPASGSNEDIAFWFRCAKAGFLFDSIAEPHLRFRISGSFWKRRSSRKALSEFACYVRGIHSLHGPITFRYWAPCARLALRLMPEIISRRAYGSWLRGG